MPVRVEPKVFFAAERTYLSWLEFAVVLSTTAGLLLNFGEGRGAALGAALGFVLVACLTLLYGLGMYLWRVRMMRRRRAIRYHDGFGPTALCLFFIVAILVNYGLKLAG